MTAAVAGQACVPARTTLHIRRSVGVSGMGTIRTRSDPGASAGSRQTPWPASTRSMTSSMLSARCRIRGVHPARAQNRLASSSSLGSRESPIQGSSRTLSRSPGVRISAGTAESGGTASIIGLVPSSSRTCRPPRGTSV